MTQTDLKLKKGKKKDVKGALKLVKELAVFEKAPNEVEVTLKEMLDWGFGKNKQFDFFLLEKNKKLIGMALYYYKYSTWKGKCLFLEDIIVTEKERGFGYGKLLFEEVINVAKKQKVRRMEWQVLDWNKDAIKFYEKYTAELDAEWVNCKFRYKQLQSM